MGNTLGWLVQWPTEVLPPRSRFGVDDIPDLTGKVVIVTGGNSGIGKVTCKYLLLKNARVYLAARTPSKAAAAIEELRAQTGKDSAAIRFLRLDLADLASVKRGAEEFLGKERQLHLLFNNAGAMLVPMDQLTKDGFDLQFGTNVIGPAYFTMLLLPLLLETAREAEMGSVRVVNDSSLVHTLAPPFRAINYDTVRAGPVRDRKLGSGTAYAQSKWAIVVWAKEFARRYGERGVVCCSLNPGIIRTELLRHSPFIRRILAWWMFPADPDGALTQLYAGTSPAAAYAHGQYFVPLARLGRSRPDTYNEEAGRKLWAFIEQVTADI